MSENRQKSLIIKTVGDRLQYSTWQNYDLMSNYDFYTNIYVLHLSNQKTTEV